ncbi:MAG: hypothetical protein WCG27_10800, partial [Pseudomonadota bacterium]
MKFALLLISLLISASCGYFKGTPDNNKDKEKDEEVYRGLNVGPSCVIDPKSFSQIFTADIRPQIQCLEENFELYSKFVIRDDHNTITKAELDSFLTTLFAGAGSNITETIGLFFNINLLVLNGEENKIPLCNIHLLFRALYFINQGVPAIRGVYQGVQDNPQSYKFYRQQLADQVTALSKEILNLMADREKIISSDKNAKLNLRQFLGDILKTFKDIHISDDPLEQQKLIDAFLSIKHFTLGGQREIINYQEIKQLIQNSIVWLPAFYDFFYARRQYFPQENGYFAQMTKNVQAIKDARPSIPEDEVVFTFENIAQIAQLVFNSADWNVNNFKETLLYLRPRLFDGRPRDKLKDKDEDLANFRAKDIRLITDWLQEILEMTYYNYTRYDQLSATLASTAPIVNLPAVTALVEYQMITPV